jgi:type II secretory pathway pseudopilin PulG
MKRVIFTITTTVALIVGASSTNAQTAEQKVQAAQANQQGANQQLKDAKQQFNAEYPAFKKDAEQKIADNSKKIAELRKNSGKPGNATADMTRKQKIDELEKRNTDLKNRLYAYEKERSDWEAFKGKFNRDMDNLHVAFHDFGSDIKK